VAALDNGLAGFTVMFEYICKSTKFWIGKTQNCKTFQ